MGMIFKFIILLSLKNLLIAICTEPTIESRQSNQEKDESAHEGSNDVEIVRHKTEKDIIFENTSPDSSNNSKNECNDLKQDRPGCSHFNDDEISKRGIESQVNPLKEQYIAKTIFINEEQEKLKLKLQKLKIVFDITEKINEKITKENNKSSKKMKYSKFSDFDIESLNDVDLFKYFLIEFQIENKIKILDEQDIRHVIIFTKKFKELLRMKVNEFYNYENVYNYTQGNMYKLIDDFESILKNFFAHVEYMMNILNNNFSINNEGKKISLKDEFLELYLFYYIYLGLSFYEHKTLMEKRIYDLSKNYRNKIKLKILTLNSIFARVFLSYGLKNLEMVVQKQKYYSSK